MKLQVINEQELLGQDFKVYGDLENPLFLAKDVAAWIEHSDTSKMIKSVDGDEKVKNNVPTLGGNQESWFLTEDGLYEVLMQSRKPIAKQFKKAVKQILKDIRKHGMYAKDELLDNPDLLIEVATKYKEERTLRLVAEQRVNELQPKADYYDTMLKSNKLITITTIAKNYGMSGNKMNQLLHEFGIQYRQGGTWLLYSKYQDKGYTHTAMELWEGSSTPKPNTKWTQKGHIFLYEFLKARDILPSIETLLKEA